MNDELRLLTIGKNPEKFLRDWDATLLEHPRQPCSEDLYTILEGVLRDYEPYKLDLHDHDTNMTRLGDVPFREKYELLLNGFRTFLKVQKTRRNEQEYRSQFTRNKDSRSAAPGATVNRGDCIIWCKTGKCSKKDACTCSWLHDPEKANTVKAHKSGR